MLNPTPYTLNNPEEVLRMVPYLIGFHPDNDLVFLLLRPNGRIRRAGRIDLDHPMDVIIKEIVTATVRIDDVACVYLVGYGPPSVRDKITTMAGSTDVVVPVSAQLLVTGDQFFCVVQGCTCPARGGVPFDPTNTTFAADLTAQGVLALPSREHLLALVEPDPHAQTATLHAIAGLPAEFRPTVSLLNVLIGPAADGSRLTDEDAARLAVSLLHGPVAQAAWLATDSEAWQRDLWLDMTRRLPDSHVTLPANLAAWSAWRRGQHELARAALDRAEQADPGNSMSQLINRLVVEYVSASQIPWPIPPDSILAAFGVETSR
jgi:hypothetical protein